MITSRQRVTGSKNTVKKITKVELVINPYKEATFAADKFRCFLRKPNKVDNSREMSRFYIKKMKQNLFSAAVVIFLFDQPTNHNQPTGWMETCMLLFVGQNRYVQEFGGSHPYMKFGRNPIKNDQVRVTMTPDGQADRWTDKPKTIQLRQHSLAGLKKQTDMSQGLGI